MKNFLRAGAASLLLISLFCLCPRPTRAADIPLEQQARSANVTLYTFSGEKWITLPDLAFLLKGSVNHHAATGRTELKFSKHNLVLLPETNKVLYDNQVQEMKQTPRLVAGVMAIPVNFATYLLNLAFIPADQRSETTFRPVPSGAGKTEGRESAAGDTGLPENVTLQPGIAELISKTAAKSEIVLVLDPGHGGHDSGAIGSIRGLEEKLVNLDLALRLENYLKNRPKLKIFLTRKDDTFVSLPDRTKFANDNNADLLISIHTNSARYNRYTADGFETFYPRSKAAVLASNVSLETDEIAALLTPPSGDRVIQQSQFLAAHIQERLASWLITPDRGIKKANFWMLKESGMTSVLVEVGFICNPNIEANLQQPEVRQAIARAIGEGLENYLDAKPLKSPISVGGSVVEKPDNE
ncbi:MAG TPA: N-acetylmuramoyl-L-alanine amidase [bacterium]|uniref:N-acetylmuramoyl-L-alanine amidase LytC n=1 Tax=candidate division TA06 bacterium ADurb.Bin417 TaxID=1852828 RepID=A0A1V5MKC9_UNCT6|nr:MAG: N-acetylmuramoyl-L-alanine amidase LytC precursor [candidate division TA06 bacterium ADurb.Bin417]HNQ34726.1 N-acetylmuramoyl-L-alanine amidase [bacterium]HNS48660.1 N-acetylmuramoyl-L-alanine amidase [bacterium]